MTDTSAAPVALEVKNLSKSFGGVYALKDVTFSAQAGTVVGVVGPNGAGKSTLLNALVNVDEAESSVLRLIGVDTKGMRPHEVARLGVARTFQTPRAFPHLTVLDNIAVGSYLGDLRFGALSGLFRLPRATRLAHETQRRAQELAEAFELEEYATQLPAGLPPAARKRMDFARALISTPRILFLDEPAAGLNDVETVEMAAAILGARDAGITVLVVEHSIELITSVVDSLIVLDAGTIVGRGSADEVLADPRVIDAYFGTDEDL